MTTSDDVLPPPGPGKPPCDVPHVGSRWWAATSRGRTRLPPAPPARPSPNQLVVRRPPTSCPDQRARACRNALVEAGGDRGIDDLAADRFQHHAPRMGHQHLPERRQRILGHGVPGAAAFGGLGEPIHMFRRRLAAFRKFPPLFGLGPACGLLDAWPISPQLLQRPERNAPHLRCRVPPGPWHLSQPGDDVPGIGRPHHKLVGDLQVGAGYRVEGEGIATALVGVAQDAGPFPARP